MFVKGQRHGFGRLDFVEDKREGNGKTMGHYEGEWKNGSFSGKGRIVWGSTGCSYDGEWLNGEMHGRGVRKDASDKILQEGFWVRGRFQDRQPELMAVTATAGRTADTVVELD